MAKHQIVFPARLAANLRAALALVALFPVMGRSAGAPSVWRVWNKADGLAESWTFGLTMNADGGVVVKHGDVATESVIDGFRVAGIPGQKVFGLFPASSDHELWSFDPEGILIYDSAGWHKYPVPEIAAFAKATDMRRVPGFIYSIARHRTKIRDERMNVVPVGGGRGLILFPDLLLEWNRATGRTRVVKIAEKTGLLRFVDVHATDDESLLVAGRKGVALLRKSATGYDWAEMGAPGQYSDFESPVAGAGNEVFVSAGRPDGRRIVLDFAGGKWREIFTGGAESLRGWRAQDGTLWVQQGEKVLQLGAQRAAGTAEVSPGLVTDILNEPDSRFWVGTAEGVARYSPPLWRSPGEAEWATGPVKSIMTDSRGRTWFLNSHFLGLHDHGQWRRFPVPAGRKETLLMDEILSLETGELVMRADSRSDILVFDPKSEKFRTVRHPKGSATGVIGHRQRGGIWVQVFEDDGVDWHLESFDGSKFAALGLDKTIAQSNMRVILEARNGDIWAGSTGALGYIHNGKYQLLGKQEAFPDTGVFSAVEAPDGHIILGGRESVTEYDGQRFHLIRSIDLAESVCLASDGTLWTASGSGVHRYRPGQWITNSVEDGLASASVHEIKCDATDGVWAGTSLGLSRFYPMADPDPPIARISDDQNLRETPPGGQARMVFTGVDRWKFTDANRLAFSWRVDKSPWSDFGPSHLASPRELRSGAHRFEVRAMDRNGNISLTPAAFDFTVLLPWYLQRLFLLFTAVALCIIGYLGRLAWRHHRRLKFQSSHDSLTGLANRTVFEAGLQQAITEARENHSGVAMILLDLDRFKPINDTLGHVVGDRFLQEVSRRLRSAVRQRDTLARMGGDEFAIVMPDLTTRAEAEEMARKILSLLRQPYFVDSFELTGSASIGVSLFPEHGDDIATLQRLADMAMYQCKAQNKDEYAIFDPEVNRLDFRSAQMAGLIRSALEAGYFRLHYQPLKAASGKLMGFEALIRLDHPQFGMIPPNDFISIAEDTGLITRVGEWVLAEACGQVQRWHAAGHSDLKINVNVSTVQLTKPDFAARVRSIVGGAGLDPSALTLEITETAIMRNLDESLAQIRELRAMGITIALDDFGTGYSTLSSLYRLPIDYIKIDRCFVQRLDQHDGYTVIEAIANLVSKFGFEVVAEGVESAAQLAGLKTIGCDLFQGYLLGRPVPADEAARLLSTIPAASRVSELEAILA
jgi:diguanylate cyclase (GGDEF)-like protein